jgi:glycosyltransferase involved in cell wall biosynthesis
MRIGIDMHSIKGLLQGTRTYILNIVEHLLALDSTNEYSLYLTDRSAQLPAHLLKNNVRVGHVSPHNRLVRIPVSFPVRLARDSIDVFHCQYMGPPFGRTPYVIMMHDILHESMPQFFPAALRTMMKVTYPLSARRASHVLTCSEYSKRDIVERYKIPEQKVTVTYHAVSRNFQPITKEESREAILRKYGLPEKYVLFVGRLEPRKNVPGLVRAFHKVKRDHRIKHKLVLVGEKYHRHEDILSAINGLGLQEEVILTGGIDHSELPAIYGGASLFVYPAFAEGFGIPPLEAMACGVPVISSNTTSLPEVIGDAGILTDPHDNDSLAAAMLDVLGNEELRNEMKSKGLARAKTFTWEKAADRTLRVYSDVHQARMKG